MIEEKGLLKSEAIVLRSFDYKENERIVTLFTENAGLISIIIKGITPKKSSYLTLATPFCRGEYVYIKSKSDLYRFYDGTILDDHLLLRLNLSHLKAAGNLTNALLHSQLPGKSSPLLYLLLKKYLQQVVHFENPVPLVCSFFLKLMKHEGVLHLEENPFFIPEEKELCVTLLSSPQFTALKTLEVNVKLKEKIEEQLKILDHRKG